MVFCVYMALNSEKKNHSYIFLFRPDGKKTMQRL